MIITEISSHTSDPPTSDEDGRLDRRSLAKCLGACSEWRLGVIKTNEPKNVIRNRPFNGTAADQPRRGEFPFRCQRRGNSVRFARAQCQDEEEEATSGDKRRGNLLSQGKKETNSENENEMSFFYKNSCEFRGSIN